MWHDSHIPPHATRKWLWFMKTCQSFTCSQEFLEKILKLQEVENVVGAQIWLSAVLDSRNQSNMLTSSYFHLPETKGWCSREWRFNDGASSSLAAVRGVERSFAAHRWQQRCTVLFKLRSLKNSPPKRREERRCSWQQKLLTASVKWLIFHRQSPAAKPRVVFFFCFALFSPLSDFSSSQSDEEMADF